MPEIKVIEAMRIAGYVLETSMETLVAENNIPAFWEGIFKSDKGQKLQGLMGRCKAMYGVSNMRNDNDMSYMVGVALEPEAEPLAEMTLFEVPAGKYVVVEVAMEELQKGYEEGFGWITEQGHEVAHGMSFEFYPEDFDQTMRLGIYLPVK